MQLPALGSLCASVVIVGNQKVGEGNGSAYRELGFWVKI